MNDRAVIGGNNPPSPIDDICAAYAATISEAENWLDGTPVENEGQMAAVDAIRVQARDWRLSLERGQKAESAPLYEAYKAALDRWKPTIEDAKRIETGLVAIVDGFKRRLAAEKAEAERKARAEAEAAMRAAREAAEKADAANIEAQRAAEAARLEAEAAAARARAAAADTVKGMRETWFHEITDHRDALHWIARNDKDAVTRFVEEYVRQHFKQQPIAGVRTWKEKVAV